MSPEIEAYLARGGRIRQFEPGASGNPVVVLGWLNEHGVPSKYVGHGFAQVGRRKVNLAGLFEIANQMRKDRGLEPFTIGRTNQKAHFFGPQGPRFRPWRPKQANDVEGEESA